MTPHLFALTPLFLKKKKVLKLFFYDDDVQYRHKCLSCKKKMLAQKHNQIGTCLQWSQDKLQCGPDVILIVKRLYEIITSYQMDTITSTFQNESSVKPHSTAYKWTLSYLFVFRTIRFFRGFLWIKASSHVRCVVSSPTVFCPVVLGMGWRRAPGICPVTRACPHWWRKWRTFRSSWALSQ